MCVIIADMLEVESMASIVEIAKAVGVSASTVSRVLNHPEYRCADPTLREKIWNTAIQMQYTPNSAARNLKLGVRQEKTCFINVLMTRSNETDTDPFFRELLRVVESEIHRHHCILSKVWYLPVFSNRRRTDGRKLEQVIREMYQETEGRHDGLVIVGKCDPEAIRLLSGYYKNIVSVNRNTTNYMVDEVTCDGEKIADLAVEYLYRQGFRMIGYAGSRNNESRYRGYLNVLARHGIDPVPAYIFETDQTEAEGYETMRALLYMENRPEALYCANDSTAVGMIRCLSDFKGRGYRPAIIASDDIAQAQETVPMLTTVRLPVDEMGHLAMNLLLDRMNKGHGAMARIELEGRLMIRESCNRNYPLR